MTKRGVVIVSVMLGLFVLSFGALGVRALTLGPDAPQPTANEVATRQQAADSLEQSIRTARADVPPALPAVPDRVAEVPAGVQVVSPAAREAAPAYEGEEYGDEEYEDDDEHYESEHGDDDHDEHEEGDHDDD